MKSRKKIVWLAHEAQISGANVAMLEYINVLQSTFDFHVILPHKGKMSEELQKKGISTSIIFQYGWTNMYPWWSLLKWIKVFIRSVAAVLQTNHLIKISQPDYVFTNTLVPFTASISAKLCNRKHVWWIHEFGQEDFGFIIGWCHEKMALKWMSKSTRLIITNSNAVTSKFSKLLPGSSVHTIYQPVSWDIPVTVALKKQSGFRFLMFGQIVPSKGHKDVLDAMKTSKNQGKLIGVLHIKGPCEELGYLQELKNIIRLQGLETDVVIETGYFKKEEIISDYDVLIVASRSEAFGRVIIEANKAGARVLVKNSGGAPELMNETNGLLYDTKEELVQILSGYIPFPDKPISFNYDEAKEIDKLIQLLNTNS